jgi:hypothetical protein
VNRWKYAVAISPSSVVLAAACWSGAPILAGSYTMLAVPTWPAVVLPALQDKLAAEASVLLPRFFFSIFTVNGLNNLDGDCCTVIYPTLSSIECCYMFLRVLIHSYTNKSRFAGSVILRNDMISLTYINLNFGTFLVRSF